MSLKKLAKRTPEKTGPEMLMADWPVVALTVISLVVPRSISSRTAADAGMVAADIASPADIANLFNWHLLSVLA